MNTEELAELLYNNYCAYVGGKAFNGDPLPDWATFSADPNKQLQAEAWRKLAHDAATYRNAKLAEFTDQELLLELFTRNNGPQPAPTNIKFYIPHLIKDIAIDKDHTATVLMPDEDFEVLKQAVSK